MGAIIIQSTPKYPQVELLSSFNSWHVMVACKYQRQVTGILNQSVLLRLIAVARITLAAEIKTVETQSDHLSIYFKAFSVVF